MDVGMAAKYDGQMREKKKIQELWTLHCREEAKENEVLERVSIGTKKHTKVAIVAKMAERTHGRRAVARGKWQGRKQSMLDSWQNRTCGSEVSKKRQQQIVRH